MELNPQQQAAVKHIQGPILVLAGAGSGKTRVITQKIAHLIKQHQVAPRHIAAVTFTNKAAREMLSRVRVLLKNQNTQGLTISTFHTLGLNILKREVLKLEHKAGFSIYDPEDSEKLILEILRKEGMKKISRQDQIVSQLRWKISNWKNNFLAPEELDINNQDHQADPMSIAAYERYNQYLKSYNAVDLDDLIYLPVKLFQKDEASLQRWRQRFQHLLIDEYQDTNTAQYQFIKFLAAPHGNLTVVGDDDQSIYSWRGAQPENMLLLKDDFPALQVIKLEQNYRSSSIILNAANQLIANNQHVFEKRLWSRLGDGDPIRIIVAQDEFDEAQKVVSQLAFHKLKFKNEFRDYALLYRGNHQAKLFERVLRENGIPYFLSGGTSFFDRTEIKDILAYLKLIANPLDDTAFLRIINTPRREIGLKTIDKLQNLSHVSQQSLLQTAANPLYNQSLDARARQRLLQFCDLINELKIHTEQHTAKQVLQRLLDDIAYFDWLKESSKDEKLAENRCKNIQELQSWFSKLSDKEMNFDQIVERFILQNILDNNDKENTANQVHLMTLHAAKGLEFPYVFLVGMEEELLPHRTSIEQDDIEEERRLAYVGVTRAQYGLTLSYTLQRKRFGEQIDTVPSRFIAELPQADLLWSGQGMPTSDEERKEKAKIHLDNLRAMLAD